MKYFFDRICFPGKTGALSPQDGARKLVNSVTQEILRITSHKQYFEGFKNTVDANLGRESVLGFGISQGIGQTVNLASSKLLATEIKKMILAYEPRLLGPQVSCKPWKSFQGALAFEVSGHLQMGDEVIRYNKQISPTGAD